MNETGEYQLHVLGALKLSRAGQELSFPRRKAASLLAYLALHPQPHSRDELATLLWGDSMDSEARNSLRVALTTLRSMLGDDVLVTDGDSVHLNPTFPLWVDACAFETYARRFLAEPPFDLSASFIDLYTGDLLPGAYDDWVVSERERLRALYVDALLHIVQQMRSRSDYQRAVQFARRVLALEPANERAHQHLMFCFVAMGDRSAALKQYALCQRALRADLDVDPLPETRALYQWIKGEPAHAPATEARRTNLPIPLSSFLGRARDMAEVKRILATHRLVTLTGPGGSGKTRLAIQIATDLIDAYSDGVWFVDLAAIEGDQVVARTTAQSIGAPSFADQPPTAAVIAFMQDRQALLALDNCEHVVSGCARLVHAILGACAQVKVLATSREPLHLSGEVVWPAPPLSMPEAHIAPVSMAALASYEAPQLFLQRATSTYPDVALADADAEAVAVVCRLLDGMPLAIELAAARLKVLSVRQIAAHMGDRFRLLAAAGPSLPARQQSLRATIDWSYNLLDADEQALLRRLSVFASTFSLATAAVVYGDGQTEPATLDVLARLVDKSLVVVETSGAERRYRLNETVKLYAWEKLVAAGEKEATVQRYIAFYAGVARAHHNPGEDFSVAEFSRWFDLEHDNIRRAVAWCQEANDIVSGVPIVAHFWHDWNRVGEAGDFSDWLESVLPKADGLPYSVRVTTLLATAFFTRSRDCERAVALCEEALALARAAGDVVHVAEAAGCAGHLALLAGRFDLAIAREEEATALSRDCAELGWRRGTLGTLGLAEALLHTGELARAESLFDQSLAPERKIDGWWGSTRRLRGLGQIARLRGDYVSAMRLCREGMGLSEQEKYKDGIVDALEAVALVAADGGRADMAARLLGAVDAQRARPGGQRRFPRDVPWYTACLSAARRQLGDEAFNRVYAAGAAMTLEQAAAYARSDG